MFVLIGQDLHGAVADINQVDQHFDSFAASHHIAAKRPECFLLIIADFNILPERVQEQQDMFHPVTSGMV